nr:hypothetical protein [Rhizobium ecuadorense]
MVPPAQSRAGFRRHRAGGYRPAPGDFGAVIPGRLASPAGAITPVLGGVGPMAIIRLMHNAPVASRGRLAKF